MRGWLGERMRDEALLLGDGRSLRVPSADAQCKYQLFRALCAGRACGGLLNSDSRVNNGSGCQ